MISEEVQSRIRKGDKEAFLSLYDMHGKRVYLAALDALGDEKAARAVVKQAFLLLRRQMMEASGPIAAEDVLDELAQREIETQRLLHGDMDAVFAALPLSAPEPPRFSEPEQRPAAAEPVREAQAQPAVPTSAETERTEEQPDRPARKPRPQADTMERVREHMREERAPFDAPLPPRRDHERRDERKGANVVVTILIVVLAALLLWIAVGILMDCKVLPFFDLGYSWFNGNVFPLFRL